MALLRISTRLSTALEPGSIPLLSYSAAHWHVASSEFGSFPDRSRVKARAVLLEEAVTMSSSFISLPAPESITERNGACFGLCTQASQPEWGNQPLPLLGKSEPPECYPARRQETERDPVPELPSCFALGWLHCRRHIPPGTSSALLFVSAACPLARPRRNAPLMQAAARHTNRSCRTKAEWQSLAPTSRRCLDSRHCFEIRQHENPLSLCFGL